MQSTVEALSLLLTWPTLFVCAAVAFMWWRRAQESARQSSATREATCWFALGVCVHFAVSFVDNLYWGLAWSARYAGFEPWSTSLFRWGVWSNVPFRQIGTMFAGYCHVRAAILFAEKDHRWLDRSIMLFTALGAAYIAII